MNSSSGLIRQLLHTCALIVMFAAAPVHSVTLYKWVDDEGNVSYQDQPPSAGQKFEEKSFSDSGANTQTNPEFERVRAAQNNPVKLYVAPDCDSCDLTRTILDMHKVPYQQIDVEEDSAVQNELIDLAGAVRVPTLLVGDTVVNGFDRNAVEDALRSKGYPVVQPETSQSEQLQ